MRISETLYGLPYLTGNVYFIAWTVPMLVPVAFNDIIVQ